ncbi:uncharacterized protein DUF4142 [Actinomadura pelletieri DSM 43383]|uniref:Uncharacterized protein DUF4142 n=1 Tax=Actinomadura pelletieri DSM 43383 TaxID=1120940 RepID=A0A495QLG3_9ACTN|nr:DUF4142 domain-containing protein [Actinomadura pelletieri]RKS73415.1 uncharacterized protein DUF4142 [Actinomadura pelletieri DSM 43383]
MRTPGPLPAAACALTAALLLGGCTPMARQSGDGGAQPAPVAAEHARQATVTTPWGPLGPADRDLLAKIRQAALWEIPVGREAARRAARPATRRSLADIARRHERLDELDRGIAAQLDVPLPDRPTAEQQSWMSEITGKSGTEYDKTAVARLRMAQGLLYARIAAVRAGTRNTLVRRFAKQCETFVHTHLTLLEGTGFVTGDTLPDQPAVTEASEPGGPNRPRSPAPAATSLIGGG